VDIGRTIGAILEGVLRGNDLDSVLSDNYRRRQRRVDPDFGGGRGGSWPGPAWPGPTWPGPVGGGGGGSGDDGWRTGGQF
jgi:hypothetical protein